MFSNPIAAEAQSFCVGSKISGIGERASHRTTFDNGNKIKK
jgi:hypothetical protein